MKENIEIDQQLEDFFHKEKLTKHNFFLMKAMDFNGLPKGTVAQLMNIISFGAQSPFQSGGNTDIRKVFMPVVTAQKELGFVQNVAKASPVPAADQLEKKTIEEQQKRAKKLKQTAGIVVEIFLIFLQHLNPRMRLKRFLIHKLVLLNCC